MFGNIVTSFGAGSGFDSVQLINDLVAASQGPRLDQVTSREQTNAARISSMAAIASSLTTFADAVKETLDGQGFVGDLISSRTDLATATVVEDGRPENLPASVEIVQLASAQREVGDVFASENDAVGERTLTITNGSGSFDVIIDSSNDSLAGLRDAINAANSGVTATILTDNAGARIVLESEEGTANSFTLTQSGPSAALNFTNNATSADSIVRVDGIELTNSSNSVTGAIPGVELSLLTAEPGTSFTISGDTPPLDVKSLVQEVVTAYNEFRTALNDATAPGLSGAVSGPLAGDRGAREVIRQLSQLTSTQLVETGEFTRLADIGIRTGSDGTLSIDEDRLDTVLEQDANAVKLMLEPAVVDENNIGLSGALEAISTNLQNDDSGALKLAQDRLEQIRDSIAEQREDILADSDRLRESLETTFANLERQLVALRATQSYVQQQFANFEGEN